MTQTLIEAATEQALKAGMAIDSGKLAAAINAGLPARCEFVSAERDDMLLAIDGDSLTITQITLDDMLREVSRKVVKTASLKAVGVERILVSYAIAQARIYPRVGRI